MARYDVQYTEPAENDLAEILRYIAVTLSEPIIAQRMLTTIEKAIDSLSPMPYKCPLVDDEHLAHMGYRKLHIKNYIAFFTINKEARIVSVERILYARRDWLHIL